MIREKKGNAFYGTMQYPGEGTTTIVEGAIHEQWSPSDPIWAQINRAGDNGHRFAVSFRETSYKTKGSSSISFEGEYHAIVSGSVMTGAWFSGNRLVGAVTLQRKSPPRMNKRK